MINDPPSYPGAEPVVISLTHWVKMSRHWRILRLAKAVFTTLVYVLSYRRSGKPLDMLGSPELTVSLAALVSADLVVCTPGGYIRSSGFRHHALHDHLDDVPCPAGWQAPLLPAAVLRSAEAPLGGVDHP